MKIFLETSTAVPSSLQFIEDVKQLFSIGYCDAEDSDAIMVFGGDGTMLRTIHGKQHVDKPFIGIGFGTMNFLMNNAQPDGPSLYNIGKLIAGDSNIEFIEITTIDVSIKIKDSDETINTFAVNDIVIGNNLMSWINYDITDNENIFGNFNGSGLCISTSTGSTGWNKNNRGLVLPLNSSNWSITGIGTSRIINEVVEEQKIEISFNSREPVHVWVDGNAGKIENCSSIILSPCAKKVKLGFFDKREYQLKRRRLS